MKWIRISKHRQLKHFERNFPFINWKFVKKKCWFINEFIIFLLLFVKLYYSFYNATIFQISNWERENFFQNVLIFFFTFCIFFIRKSKRFERNSTFLDYYMLRDNRSKKYNPWYVTHIDSWIQDYIYLLFMNSDFP